MIFRIKEARERAGLNQTELAAILGVAPSTFNGYEKGNHDPKSNVLAEIAKVCDTSVDYLLGLTTNPAPNKDVPTQQKLSKEAIHIAMCFEYADDDGRALLRSAADYIEKVTRLSSAGSKDAQTDAGIDLALDRLIDSQSSIPEADRK